MKVVPLTDEEIASLIEEVIKNPQKYPEEAKLILIEKTYTTIGSLVDCWKKYEIVLGEVKEVVLNEEHIESPPQHDEYTIAFIPFTKPVVIHFIEKRYVEGSENTYEEFFYIFTGEKWVKVETI